MAWNKRNPHAEDLFRERSKKKAPEYGYIDSKPKRRAPRTSKREPLWAKDKGEALERGMKQSVRRAGETGALSGEGLVNQLKKSMADASRKRSNFFSRYGQNLQQGKQSLRKNLNRAANELPGNLRQAGQNLQESVTAMAGAPGTSPADMGHPSGTTEPTPFLNRLASDIRQRLSEDLEASRQEVLGRFSERQRGNLPFVQQEGGQATGSQARQKTQGRGEAQASSTGAKQKPAQGGQSGGQKQQGSVRIGQEDLERVSEQPVNRMAMGNRGKMMERYARTMQRQNEFDASRIQDQAAAQDTTGSYLDTRTLQNMEQAEQARQRGEQGFSAPSVAGRDYRKTFGVTINPNWSPEDKLRAAAWNRDKGFMTEEAYQDYAKNLEQQERNKGLMARQKLKGEQRMDVQRLKGKQAKEVQEIEGQQSYRDAIIEAFGDQEGQTFGPLDQDSALELFEKYREDARMSEGAENMTPEEIDRQAFNRLQNFIYYMQNYGDFLGTPPPDERKGKKG